MKKLLAVVFAVSASYALQAPYLISATAVTDTSVQLSWRNNDAATTGFIVQRKDTTATTYKFIDSVTSATQLTYLDLAGLKPSTLYTYQVIAYSPSAVSDTSNSVQVTTSATPPFIDTFVAPGISVLWNYDTSKSVQVKIANLSNSETGYLIYRSAGFSSAFSMIGQIVLAEPESGDTIVFQDTTAAINTWYSYEAAAYKSGDSVLSIAYSTFTFKSQEPQQIAKFTKLANCPISDSGGWAAIAGDSIILKENNAPAGKFTAINITTPAAPTFAGYIDSTTLLSYPLQTLIPVYLQYGVKNGYGAAETQVLHFNNQVVIIQGTTISLFQIAGTNLTSLNSVTISGDIFSTLQLNDSLFAVQFAISQPGESDYAAYYCLPVKISANQLVKLDPTFTGYAYDHMTDSYPNNSYAYNRGLFNSIIFIPVNWIGPGLNYYNMIICDIDLNRTYIAPGTSARTFTNNSGYYLSATQFLSQDSIHSNAVYAENIIDLNAYQTAVSQNAVFTDSFSTRQNVLVDTVNKRLYILYKTNMSIFSYAFSTVGVKNNLSRLRQLPGDIRVLPGPLGVTIVFPRTARNANLFFYDLTGRMVDNLSATGSNAVLWRPKARGMCIIVSAKIDGENYSARFVAR
jgi:hypothetical protein